jgi:hypothetical protein
MVLDARAMATLSVALHDNEGFQTDLYRHDQLLQSPSSTLDSKFRSNEYAEDLKSWSKVREERSEKALQKGEKVSIPPAIDKIKGRILEEAEANKKSPEYLRALDLLLNRVVNGQEKNPERLLQADDGRKVPLLSAEGLDLSVAKSQEVDAALKEAEQIDGAAEPKKKKAALFKVAVAYVQLGDGLSATIDLLHDNVRGRPPGNDTNWKVLKGSGLPQEKEAVLRGEAMAERALFKSKKDWTERGGEMLAAREFLLLVGGHENTERIKAIDRALDMRRSSIVFLLSKGGEFHISGRTVYPPHSALPEKGTLSAETQLKLAAELLEIDEVLFPSDLNQLPEKDDSGNSLSSGHQDQRELRIGDSRVAPLPRGPLARRISAPAARRTQKSHRLSERIRPFC